MFHFYVIYLMVILVDISFRSAKMISMNENHTGSQIDRSAVKHEISFVVGIGASAGCIDALGELVEVNTLS